MNKKTVIALEIGAVSLVSTGLILMNIVPLASGIGLAAFVAAGSIMNNGGGR